MKKRITLIVFLTAIIISSCVTITTKELTSAEKEKISAEIVDLSNKWVEAIKAHDIESIDHILSEQVMYFIETGARWNKDSLLNDYASSPDFESTSIYDVQVDVYDSNCAMITGKALFVFQGENGETVEDESLWSNLYRKENEQWKCVFGMGCEIGE